MSTATPTVRSLDTRIDDIEKEFLKFQARMEMVVSLQKWIAGFALATLVAVIVQMLSISFGAGRLLEKVENQAKAIDEMKAEMHGLARLPEKVENQAAILQELKTEIRELRKEVGQMREDLHKRK